MFSLEKLYIKDFLSFKETEIQLKKAGLYLISGHNELGGDSNGSGKTAIISAISFALWGKTAGGLQGKEVARWNSDGNYIVELELMDEANVYKIRRIPDKTEFFINNKSQVGHKRDVQELINQTFHSSYDIFFASTLFTSAMSDYLANMGDAAKKKLFRSILNLDQIDKAYALVKEKYDKMNELANKSEQNISLLKDLIGSKQLELNGLKRQFDNFEDNKQSRIDQKMQQQVTKPIVPADLVFELKAQENFLNRLEKSRDNMVKEQEYTQGQIQNAYEKVGSFRQKVLDLTQQLNLSETLKENSACDKCGSSLGPNYTNYVNDLRTKLIKAEQESIAIDYKLKELETKYQSITDFFESLENTSNKKRELEGALEKNDLLIKEWETTNKNLEDQVLELRQSINPYEELIKTISDASYTYKTQLTSSETEFIKAKDSMDILAFLKKVFSREGVAAQIIETSFGRLQAIANRYLSQICSEGLRITIAPQRELKSKTLKEEIDIFVTNKEGIKMPYAALSGGQKQRLNIALLLALYQLCRDMQINTFDFLILDEVLDLSLADKGQHDIVALLRNLLMGVSQIFVISHKEGISQDFDYEITVRRNKKGVSEIL